VEEYRTEEEQVEALKRWWDENGRSTIAAVIIALSAGFGWQTWKGYDQGQRENASDAYQAMLQAVSVDQSTAQQEQEIIALAGAIKENHESSAYAQFAALHLARLAVEQGDLAEAEAQLRWVLGKADKGSDAAWVAQLRLARVLAASGDADQSLAILAEGGDSPYQASYAVARGDVLLQLGRTDEARDAYTAARMAAASNPGRINLMTLDQKLQSLTPVPPQATEEEGQ
jgi:predicted negative regulator of RcsB-dependent stress response